MEIVAGKVLEVFDGQILVDDDAFECDPNNHSRFKLRMVPRGGVMKERHGIVCLVLTHGPDPRYEDGPDPKRLGYE